MTAIPPNSNDSEALLIALKADIETGAEALASGKKRIISDIDAYVTEIMSKYDQAS